jgi:hypothetical protein
MMAQRLFKESPELLDGVVSNLTVQIFEDCEHRLTFGWPLYLERYIKGEVGIDLFLKVRPSGGDAQDFVATLEYAGAPSKWCAGNHRENPPRHRDRRPKSTRCRET